MPMQNCPYYKFMFGDAEEQMDPYGQEFDSRLAHKKHAEATITHDYKYLLKRHIYLDTLSAITKFKSN